MVNQILSYLKNKKATFDFWLARKTITLDDYVDVIDSDDMSIKIKKGKYAGVIFSYDTIHVREDNNAGFLDFKTIIIKAPEHLNEHFISEKAFVELINNILRLLLIESINSAEKLIDEQRRTVDTDESIEERELHEESSSFSEERVPERKRRKKAIQGDSEIYSEVQQRPKRRSSASNTPERTKSDRNRV